jgi:two-component system OmpR family response regulator
VFLFIRAEVERMNILLLEDDPKSASLVVEGLVALGHQVQHEAEGNGALRRIRDEPFDVLILDRMVPDIDGLSVLKAMRAEGNRTPALLLTAMSGIEDRVVGLEEGADDYLVKPFAFSELAARLQALFRRSSADVGITTLRVGKIEMDLVERKVRRGDRVIQLQPREFTLLEQLMRSPGSVVTRTMLLDQVWNFGFDPKTNIVETHMSRLRLKLNEGFAVDAIRTVRGSGYMINNNAD